ncbi:hypothetical protein ACEPAH_1129 [Sanghuangporus vaninii]
MRRVALSAFFALAACSVRAAEDAEKPSVKFEPTTLKAEFLEQFTDDWSARWTVSEATKKTPVGTETFSYVGKWEVEEPLKPVIDGDKGLVAKSKAAHHAISAPFATPIERDEKPLVVQYEVKYQDGGNCGGGYVKLLEDGFQTSGKEFDDKTPWTIMFGPDLTCPGTKVHFIFRHKNPVTGEFEEKHLKTPPKPKIEKLTNLYTLIVNPDNSYSVLVNGESVSDGNLLENFNPPVNPPTEIDDPDDKKPDDWVEQKKIPDPDAKKPDDWDEDAPYEVEDEDAVKPGGWLDDEPEFVPDPDAEKPEEWDDEEDGEWIAPTIRNPKCEEAPGCGEWKRPYKPNPNYKGKWYAPLIDNPAYIGEWKPRKIPNPEFFEDLNPVKSLINIGGIGIELWTMTPNILFDNIYIGHSAEDAKTFAAETFDVKHKLEEEANKKAKKIEDEEDEQISFKEDPIGFIRQAIFDFIDDAKEDPIAAFKAHPKTGGSLAISALTFVGMILSLGGLIGAQQKPITKAAGKKTEAHSPEKKVSESAPVAPAGGKKEEESAAKKRVGK